MPKFAFGASDAKVIKGIRLKMNRIEKLINFFMLDCFWFILSFVLPC